MSVLATLRFAAGDRYRSADIAHYGWPWGREFAGVRFDKSPHVARWYAEVLARSAVHRAIARVNALVAQAL